MPTKAPRLCPCGKVIPSGERCTCERKAETARKAIYDRNRPSSSARGYTGAWDKAKRAFLAKHKHCVRCGKDADTVDHIKPHRQDRELFWDRANWQALCASCHNSTKQREERKGG
ncbi:HNH endonuclease [Stagnihabitans tardus]|uniref:Putative HNH nuclease YajD n=1 Tax=Stagnihabitans tardus TaxID=2699202 RepID=A0AAE5BSI9_9RHOB|nr:HNH endonuclease [Stagnihabitans tardus]NBZ87905.1 HNH endonuclease [Stagnihabitans tardus]